MDPCIVAGTAHRTLGEAVARSLGVAPLVCTLERFPDGELHVELREPVARRDVVIVQSAVNPVGESVLEVLMIADAARRLGASGVTAVLPYVGYARADRRTREGQPLAGRVVAGLFDRSLVDRVIAIDLHSSAVAGFFPVPVDHLDALPVLADALERVMPENAVIVAPDVGASKRAEALAARWKLPTAVVHKKRVSGSAVVAHAVTGDVQGRAPVIVDDMIVTGSTLVAAMNALRDHGALEGPVIAATHALCPGEAIAKLASIGTRVLVVTDTLPSPRATPFPLAIASVAPRLGDAIGRLARGDALADLLVTI